MTTTPELITPKDLLAADTSMGAVTLDVADLDVMTAYYRDAIALQVLSSEGSQVTLGRGTEPVVILRHSPELKAATPGQAGLFHTAILYDTQEALAATVATAAQYPGVRFVGSSDHLVSQAFYFDDPEGNGIELYWDRDRTQWSWTHGQVEMSTLYLDPNQFLREHLTEQGLADPTALGGAVVGHVHLSVGDVATAQEFYVHRLGFETTASVGNQALFVSAGKYHHHMAMNVWNSRGAGPRQRTLGLGQVDIVVPTADEVGALTERMKHFGLQTRDDGRTVSFDDPWANLINVRSADA
ncbi:VOC family protein [Ornithinimicrobium faecis]|uniref:VOC family protein n=1 Tax=Ornithinimicrobium faecis TaxID=2934158 RepID=A0ABY4YYE7_9MICO|nr:VOC family protein [Ornithinimicrobium sp. HY1793]USQ81775.1 VOC family protein [Ornithinimicrobium sp. HY1793]